MVHLETQFRPLTTRPDESAIDTVRQLIMGFRNTQLVYVAARLGIADILARGPKTPTEVGAEVGAEPGALYRVLRALASLGIFADAPDGTFTMTPLAEALCSAAEGSLRDVAVLYGDEWLWRGYGRMQHMLVVTGGRERTESEYGAVLEKAGLRLTRVIATRSALSLVEAVAA